ncbi:hypothetical protein VE01_07189 [Pseudogymnoascus verrucosus]|uniref:non-specific serine/threonine protein kinase n=1 Tax=Pseudogymnoascus verrucosus TaxID=342668 RepID=A0A1B8GF37_9PEZI|nr:uncharacterized protein VE01_07189 [Pseudogymnoascus verrucosus]OBT94441.1 hypothetical protein VE01_07189 [Pseudogymnoascus verrucosus]
MDTRERPFGGSECVIVVLKDEEGSKWAVRFPLQFRAFPEHVVLTAKREAELRLAIEKSGIARMTRMKAFSATFDNPAQFPFIVSEWVEGTQLRWTESFPELPQRDKNIRPLHVTTLINRKIKRAENNKLPGAAVSECLDQQSLIAEYLIPDLDDPPCVLVHGDLTTENVIVDEDFNVKAIIDLGFAEIIPLQFSACFPNFLTHEFESLHEPFEAKHGSETDGPLVWRSKNTEVMRRDREFYLRCVEEFSRGDPMLEAYYELLAAEDEIKRYRWIMAATKLKNKKLAAKVKELEETRENQKARLTTLTDSVLSRANKREYVANERFLNLNLVSAVADILPRFANEDLIKNGNAGVMNDTYRDCVQRLEFTH